MATVPDNDSIFDGREQSARVDQVLAELQRLSGKGVSESRFDPFTLIFSGLGAGAALIAAGAALAKVLIS